MQATGAQLERFVKSFAFSLLLFLVWIYLAGKQILSLRHDFQWIEFLFAAYNVLLALLFLIRTRPSAVSMNPMHWLVALITSFAGLFFQRGHASSALLAEIGNWLLVGGILGGVIVAISLGRSYDFVPALRGVQTGWLYRIVRHPMYACSMLVRLGYVLRSPSILNVLMFAGVVILYRVRAGFEERIMCGDARYVEYLSKVRERFVLGIY
ncbi:MAG: hypothetical protein HY287_15360 [Planctomycetes bacterium]|nr:hypothetical protein [Planctomycetota bacterium]MBI3835702.1 hypothetical protein [Planctomycetota bacterium]